MIKQSQVNESNFVPEPFGGIYGENFMLRAQILEFIAMVWKSHNNHKRKATSIYTMVMLIYDKSFLLKT